VRTAVSLPPFTDATSVVALAVEAEQAGWDGGAPGVPADEYASAGATWLIESTWPEGDWVADIRTRVTAGP
jgi:hypothetical protein